jgi:hypothetical protein
MKLIRAVLVATALCAAEAQALSPDEAYAAIPHRRIAYDAEASALAKPHAESLKKLFAMSDQGVVLRVEGMRAVSAGNTSSVARTLDEYDKLVASLRGLDVAKEVAGPRDLVVDALIDQRRFLAAKRNERYQFGRDVAMSPDVRQASDKLKRAYGLLLKAFPNERPRNKEAFFDHLCALDYL